MPPEALALRTSRGRTALHIAALYGNTKAAVILVEKHPTSLYIRSYDQNQLPLHFAANSGHKDTLLYLLSVIKEDDPVSKPFAYPSGALLLYQAVDSEFYENKDEDYWRYQPLLKATLRGDWDSAKGFFDQDPDALTAHITDAK
ncbi:hypothetical protein TEA_025093 [Camellia sinensis var. sinensis]|uniref:Uncharacterized protein n=1 Tax=Camellia sinensis var. sinensis TaxID=542762 RepID=A0A4S4E1C1_CAMSN|nr:hypothetical protein TEA_025093 [Camellia sinensis var. sinensis]